MSSSSGGLSRTTVEKTSAVLSRVLAELPGGKVSIGLIVLKLRRRSFGGLLLVLAALGLLPGISFFAGLAILVPALQMVVGLKAPLLPRLISQREVEAAGVKALGERAIPWIERMERFVKPRWLVFTSTPMPSLIGILIFGLALVIMLPLPFSNLPPAVALLCLSLGILERDGLMISVGMIAAAVALAVGVFIVFVAVEGMTLFFSKHFD